MGNFLETSTRPFNDRTKPPAFGGLTGKKLGLAISVVSTTGFLLFGYDQGLMSGIITAPEFNAAIPETKDNSTIQGFVTAIYEVGCLAGAIFILCMGDTMGRRYSIMLGAIVMILGTVIQVCTFYTKGSGALTQFVLGRIITGVGNGMNTSSIPTYQAECSKTKNRGLLICIEGGTIAFGTLISYWLNFGVSYTNSDVVWRFPIAFQVLFALIIIIGMTFLPESPRWLLSKDRDIEGTYVIAALQARSIEAEETNTEKRIILDSMAASAIGKTRFKDLLTNGKTQHFRRMLLGASSQLMQQVGGCNAVIYYFPILFEKSIGESRHMSLVMGGVNMIVYSAFATVSWFIIEKAGRRKLFLWGTVGQMVSMIITFACLIPGTPSAAKGAAAGLFLYIASFGATWLPLPWLYPAEINPLRTRGKANAVSTITNWLFNFLIVMITPIMIDRIGWGTYLFFGAMNACFLPIIYFFYPETKMRSLEEIDFIFAKGFTECKSYVTAAKELPMMAGNGKAIEQMMIQYGFSDPMPPESGVEVPSGVGTSAVEAKFE
ncbi:general substrate transporter [Terfezia boudieri ATCC MYA-4762]|uniref:General substrate transporter n=1 Tax=Terfezia boudieri ATCC MYA-4762 TaxID=1051890 RepID=A0A3N4LBJ3_9PEZI|nr:general substrate transporter [Terfezia boudieri ATCC MYA-4762]